MPSIDIDYASIVAALDAIQALLFALSEMADALADAQPSDNGGHDASADRDLSLQRELEDIANADLSFDDADAGDVLMEDGYERADSDVVSIASDTEPSQKEK